MRSSGPSRAIPAPDGARSRRFVLWSRFLKHNPKDPSWPDRDRFVLSCGHASMLQYALLHLSVMTCRWMSSGTSASGAREHRGHPERGHTVGVETTTGPLGQGVGNAVGMAIAERILADRSTARGSTSWTIGCGPS